MAAKPKAAKAKARAARTAAPIKAAKNASPPKSAKAAKSTKPVKLAKAAKANDASSARETAWDGFSGGLWQSEVNVRDFIQVNYTPYDGDESFLKPATARTQKVWKKLTDLFIEERKKGVLDVSQIPSSITAHAPGYIDKDNEVIVGLQTDRTAASGSSRTRSRPTGTSPTRTSSRRSRSTARRTTTPCSTRTRPTSAAAGARTS
jgi:hypothetical protein